MMPVRPAMPGATRICPHCRQTILESAAVCPACNKHLRFDAKAAQEALPAFTPLRVEGTIRPAEAGETWEYSVIATIRNERGEEVARHVIGVGALGSAEARTFTVAVAATIIAERRSGTSPRTRTRPDP